MFRTMLDCSADQSLETSSNNSKVDAMGKQYYINNENYG